MSSGCGAIFLLRPHQVSEYTAWSSSYYTRIVQTILKEMGHDPNLVQTVTGFAETGKALVNGGVDKVIFTGSPEVRHCFFA